MPVAGHRTRRISRNAFVAAALALALLTGCPSSHGADDAGAPDAATRCLGGSCDAGAPDADTDSGAPDAGERSPDAGAEPSCHAQPETCNGVDDDCNGAIDDAPAATECSIHATASCVDGACTLGDCEAGWADCDGAADNGCETETETDPAACGACDHVCGSGIGCRDGVCDDERIVQITQGDLHTCVLRQSGSVVCWGDNAHGQLGTGDSLDRSTPAVVAGTHDYIAIDAGAQSTCAIRRDGGVDCWGANASGQLGDGTQTDRNTPTAVIGLSGSARSISLSLTDPFALVVTDAGNLWGWGTDNYGQLGDTASPGPNSVPIQIFGPPVQQPVAGTSDACSLTSAWDIDCWGTPTLDVATAFSGVAVRALQIAPDGHVCALDASGTLHCAGPNNLHQVGPFDCSPCETAQLVPLAGPATQFAVGLGRSCALAGGQLYCWGLGYYGDGRSEFLPSSTALIQVDLATQEPCVLDQRARVWCYRPIPVLQEGLYHPST